MALEQLHGGLSPGWDGLLLELFQAFVAVFVPRLLAIMQQFLWEGGGARFLVGVTAAVPS